MANQIYDVTHEGLSTVISAKAATHVLRKAIESQGHDSKSITGSEMRDVLMGPVYQELTTIMPKDGVERTLKQIIKNLKKQVKAARASKEKSEELETYQQEISVLSEPADAPHITHALPLGEPLLEETQSNVAAEISSPLTEETPVQAPEITAQEMPPGVEAQATPAQKASGDV